jgi:trimeric autotransporter adhesin
VAVPTMVTIKADESYAYFRVRGIDLTSADVQIDASATGFSAPSSKLNVKVLTPTLTISGLSAERSVTSARDGFELLISTPGRTLHTVAEGLTFDLSFVGVDPAGVVDSFYTASTAGAVTMQVSIDAESDDSATVYVATPTKAGTYKVRASAPGIVESTSDAVDVVQPGLSFSRETIVVGKGMNTYSGDLSVSRVIDGSAFSGAEDLTVRLVSADPSKVSVPETVTILAGSSSVSFRVTGVALTGAAASVAIDATAEGHSAPTDKLRVSVVTPTLEIVSLETDRSPASQRDEFYVRLTVQGAPRPTLQTAAARMPVKLSFAEMTSPGMVDGFYSASVDGAVIGEVAIDPDKSSSSKAYVGVPSAAGTYKVLADASGLGTATSALVDVRLPELTFSRTSVVVGKGLKTYSQDVYVARSVDGTQFNGTADVIVNLSCSAATVCSVPASVTIPKGSSYIYFRIDGIGIGNTTITATAVGYVSSPGLPVEVKKPQLTLNSLSGTTVGNTDSFTVGLYVAGAVRPSSQTAREAITVDLASSSPGVATVPVTATIEKDKSASISLNLSGVAPGKTTVTASASDFESTTSGDITISP